MVLLVNLTCIAYHLLFSLPEAGEGTRFDLNGHVLVDFIGQRALTGWTGRLRLVGMDIVVMALQTIGCGVLEQGEKKALPMPKDDTSTAGNTTTSDEGETVDPAPTNSEEAIEMQPLMRNSVGQDETASPQPRPPDRGVEGSPLTAAEETARDGLEALYTGQTMLVSISVWSLLRDQYYERRNRALSGRV